MDEDGYQRTTFQMIGGDKNSGPSSNGIYSLSNPWGGVPCEVWLVAANADGAANLYIGTDDASTPVNINGESGWRGTRLDFAVAGACSFAPTWTPINERLFLTVQSAGAAHAWITVIFRRAVPRPGVVASAGDAHGATGEYWKAMHNQNKERSQWMRYPEVRRPLAEPTWNRTPDQSKQVAAMAPGRRDIPAMKQERRSRG